MMHDNFLEKTEVQGNLKRLRDAVDTILQHTQWPPYPLTPPELTTISINLKRTAATGSANKWTGLSGRLRDLTTGEAMGAQNDYTIWNEEVPSYLVKLVKQLEKTHDFQAGRVRLSNLKSMMCLRTHADWDQRYHLAIQTNLSTFFYNNTTHRHNLQYEGVTHLGNFSGVGYHIPADGFFYKANTLLPHTAVNSGPDDRIHLVVDICP